LEYLEILGGLESPAFGEFKRLFREGFEAARKHCDRIITLVELMQKGEGFTTSDGSVH
jgi:phosphatidylinositol 4-kinase B